LEIKRKNQLSKKNIYNNYNEFTQYKLFQKTFI